MALSPLRITTLVDEPPRSDGEYVLYWMIAARRASFNFSLDHALAWSNRLGKPLVVFEPLRLSYPWTSRRFHRFVIDGMLDNQAAFAKMGITYIPYVEPEANADKPVLAALAARAALVVTDDSPSFFFPRMVAATARKLNCRMEQVDTNGMLPLQAASSPFPSAYVFRRFLQKTLSPFLTDFPTAEPKNTLPPFQFSSDFFAPFPNAYAALCANDQAAWHALKIDHNVQPTDQKGGSRTAETVLTTFLSERLPRYDTARNDIPSAASGLSPYLHFGHISTHQIVSSVMRLENWHIERLAQKATGKKTGWFGMSAPSEAFLDELITWRELGLNAAATLPNYERYTSLPDWAKATLSKHIADPRPYVYTRDTLEAADTHDLIWNAAQRELVTTGNIHNYLRMLWGKKILEWSETPEEALDTMIELNNKYALDGRDPNSYSGIFWILGRYDRPWGPERPIFGTVRYMSSDSTARKIDLKSYLEHYGR